MRTSSVRLSHSLPLLVTGLVFALASCGPATPPPAQTSSTDTSSATTSTEAPSEPSESATDMTMTVPIYLLDMAGAAANDCSAVGETTREVPQSDDQLTAALVSLVSGTLTPAEEEAGLGTWFEGATADALISARIENGTAFVDFQDFSQIIPNASSSCGSAGLLTQLESTVSANSDGARACFSFSGDPDAFYSWLQLTTSDACG